MSDEQAYGINGTAGPLPSGPLVPVAANEDDARAHPPACEPHLLALLVCPYTRTTLAYDAARQELISRPERLAFPIRDGIPILVREEARDLDKA